MRDSIKFLAVEGESMKECLSELAPLKARIVLKYHKGSEKTGKAFGIDCRLWDVISPKLDGYKYDSDSHIPTLSIDGLRKVGLIR